MSGKVRFGPSGRQISLKRVHCPNECVSPGPSAPARLLFDTSGSPQNGSRASPADVVFKAERITEKTS